MKILISVILLTLIVAACNPNPPSVIAYSDLPPEGDVARGEVLFDTQINLAPPCSACHNENSPASPDLVGFGESAGTIVEGESAHEYAFYSIVEPGRYIVPDFGNAMYNEYDENLTPQDIADLIAYTLTL